MDRIEAETMPEAIRNLDTALNNAVMAMHSISQEIDHIKNKDEKKINVIVIERILPNVFNPFRDAVFAMTDIQTLSKKRQEEFDYSEERLTRSYQASQSLRDKLALLTAEPEPCEDAEQSARTITMAITKWRQGCDPHEPEAQNAIDAIDHLISASQVADKRVEELRELVETLRGALVELRTSYNVNCECPECKRKRKLSDEALAATEPKP